MASTPFEVIYASTLKRAKSTAKALQEGQELEPKPPIIESLDIREQNFGIAEGQRWTMSVEPNKTLEQHFAEGKFPMLDGRDEKFTNGESLDDLALRAARAINELVMPHVWKAAREGRKGVHVAIVSHGLCISEVQHTNLDLNDNCLQHSHSSYRHFSKKRRSQIMQV